MKRVIIFASALFAAICAKAWTVTAEAVGAYDSAMGTVAMTSGDTTIASGSDVAEGATVTITATAKDPLKPFVKWLGTGIPEEQKTSATLTIENLAGDVNVVPVFEGMWLFDGSGTLTEIKPANVPDENRWKLHVHGVDNSARTCTLGQSDTTIVANAIAQVSKAYNPGEGVLDVLTPIVDGNGNLWKVTKLVTRCFSQNDGTGLGSLVANDAITGEYLSKGCLKAVSVPMTLTTFNGQPFNLADNGSALGLETIIFDCPDMTGTIGNYAIWNCTQLKKIVLKCPKLTGITRYNFNGGTWENTDVSEWDLSGLQTLGEADNNSRFAFSSKQIKGVLRLPSIETIGKGVFKNVQSLTAIELGLNGTLKKICTEAFAESFKVDRLLLGGASGWTIAPGAISLASGTKQIVFLNENLPKVEEGAMFTGDTAEKTVSFYVPDCTAWKMAIGKIAADRTYPAENNFFGTTHAQYVKTGTLGDVGFLIPYSVKVADPRYGDTIEVWVNDEKVHEGLGISGAAPAGTKVTFKATCKPGNDPHWKCLNFGWKSDNETDSFTLTTDARLGFANAPKEVNVELWARHPWTLKEATEENPTTRITDGVWTLNVIKCNAAGGEDSNGTCLGIGAATANATYGHAYAEENTGSGILDLNGTITDSQNNTYKIVTIFGHAFTPAKNGDVTVKDPNARHSITDLVFPETFKNFQTQTFNDGDDAICHENLKRLVFDVPEMTSGAAYVFWALRYLDVFYVNMPASTAINTSEIVGGDLNRTDRSTWNFAKVETLANWGFGFKTGDYINKEEVLKFPRMHTIGVTGQLGAMRNTKVYGFELGMDWTHNDHRTLTINARDFIGNSTLKSIKFGAYDDYDVFETAFDDCSAIEELTFVGRCLMDADKARTVLDRILTRVPAKTEDGKIQTVIRASVHAGWDRILNPFEDNEEEETAKLLETWLGENETIKGVYATKDGERKAWIVHVPSEQYDLKGTVLIIR